jgi:hypothetical protein
MIDWRKVSETLNRKRKPKDYQRHWSNLQRSIALGILVENEKGQITQATGVSKYRDKFQAMNDDRRLLEYLRDSEVEHEIEICWADAERDLLLPANDARKKYSFSANLILIIKNIFSSGRSWARMNKLLPKSLNFSDRLKALLAEHCILATSAANKPLVETNESNNSSHEVSSDTASKSPTEKASGGGQRESKRLKRKSAEIADELSDQQQRDDNKKQAKSSTEKRKNEKKKKSNKK